MRIRGNINISPDFFIGNRMNDGGQDDTIEKNPENAKEIGRASCRERV